MSFETATLDSLCELVVDCPHSTPKWTDEGIIVLRNQNIKNGVLDLSAPSFTNEEDYLKRIKRAAPKAGDIVFTREAPMGEVCMIPEGLKCCLGQRQVLLRPKSDVNGQYLFWALQSPYVQQQIAWNEGTGSTVSNVRIPVLKALNIPRIGNEDMVAKSLSDIASKMALNTQTNQTLEQMAQAIFKSWFVDFDPVKAKMNGELPEGMDAATASLFPEKLVESEEGMIPEGWSVEPLKNISRVINGRAYKNTEFKEEGTPIIRIQNLTGKGKTVYSDMELPEDKLVEHGDLIFAWSATFGPHLWRGPKSIYHYHIWKMDVDETKFGKYLLYLHLARLTDYLKNQGTGSIFTHLTKGIMESQKLVIPNESVVEAFSKVVTPLFAQIDSLHKENKILEQLRDTLLPKLLSGEIELGKTQELIEVE